MIEVFKMHKTHSSTRIVDLTPQNGCRQVCQYDIPAFIHWISLKKIAIYCPKLINTNAYPNVYEQAHCVKKINCFKQNHAVWNSNQEVPIVFFPKEKYKDTSMAYELLYWHSGSKNHQMLLTVCQFAKQNKVHQFFTNIAKLIH